MIRALLLLFLADAVNRALFRTCEQAAFCRRFSNLRNKAEEARPVYTAAVLQGITAELTTRVPFRNHGSGRDFELAVSGYGSGAIRFQFRDPHETTVRYSIPVGDVLVEDIDARRIMPTVTTGEDALTLEWKYELDGSKNSVSVTVQADGVFGVHRDDKLIQVFNYNKMLNFESHRFKGELPGGVANCAAGVDATCFGGEHHERDLWEESFGGAVDTKPYGPMGLGIDVTFLHAPAIFGLPEHTNKMPLDYKEPYRFFNLDVFEYEVDSPMALYGAIPMVTGLHDDTQTASSMFWNNPSDSFAWTASEGGSSRVDFTSESGSFDVFVFPGPTPAHTVQQYHSVTGPATLPPIFSLGKHQCRWNYMDTADTKQVDQKFDQYDLPYDVLWLDIEHTDGKRYFTWDKRNFEDPHEMIEDIASRGRKMVTIVDPHIKVDDQYSVYKNMPLWTQKPTKKEIDDPADKVPEDWDMRKELADPAAVQPAEWNEAEDGQWNPGMIANPAYRGVWKPRRIPDPHGGTVDFDGWCWPGNSKYPDFTSPKVRKYWAEQFAFDKYGGSSPNLFTWNDMNEPSVFNGPQVTMPYDAIQEGNVEHRNSHNLYGMYLQRATFEGHLHRAPDQRPFILSRAFYAGTHRYGAIWTGDNFALWSHYERAVPMLLSLSIVGLSFTGADVGGFFKHPDKALITRWHQFGSLAYPFYRSHAHLETPRREPWMYNDDEVLDRIREAGRERYSFMPLWYTGFAEHTFQGLPIVRPIWFDHMSDTSTYMMEAQNREIIVGKALLVVASLDPAKEKETAVYLPAPDQWYDYWTGTRLNAGLHMVPNTWDHVPMYIRAGSIVSKKARARRSTTAQRLDPYTLHVYTNEAREARGALYVDDGNTNAYLRGEYDYSEWRFADGALTNVAIPLGREFVDRNVNDGSPIVKPQTPIANLKGKVGLSVERIDFHGTSFASAQLERNGAAPVQLQTIQREGVLTIKLPTIEVGTHDWRIVLGGDSNFLA